MTSLASGAVTSTTESVWEGGRLALERDSNGTTYRYVYGPGSLPLEMIVTAPGQQPVPFAYLCDRAGSVIALTDSNGVVATTYAYDPWGAPTSPGPTGIAERNPLRYRGYYHDVATALYYLPARYYDPAVARFLSPDPAAPSAGDPLSLNRYAYCVARVTSRSRRPCKGLSRRPSLTRMSWATVTRTRCTRPLPMLRTWHARFAIGWQRRAKLVTD